MASAYGSSCAPLVQPLAGRAWPRASVAGQPVPAPAAALPAPGAIVRTPVVPPWSASDPSCGSAVATPPPQLEPGNCKL